MLKAEVPSDDGVVYTVDVIEHEMQFWLVPSWLYMPELKQKRPGRIIGLSGIPHQILEGPFGPHNLSLNSTIAKGVLDGSVPPGQAHGLVVIDQPDIVLPSEPTEH